MLLREPQSLRIGGVPRSEPMIRFQIPPCAPPVSNSRGCERMTRFAGLFRSQLCWVLTWRGRLCACVSALSVTFILLVGVHPFLALTERVPAHLLVVEGWVPTACLKAAADEFDSGKYEQAVLVRPVLDIGDKYESGRFSVHWLARLLVADGIPDSRLATLFPNVARKDRTYHSALAVKEWLSEQHLSVAALNVATTGPHARRSRLLYEKAFGPGVKIGIVALQSPEYDPRHWWRTSEGVREVIGESVAYVYARFFFIPSHSESESSGVPADSKTSEVAHVPR